MTDYPKIIRIFLWGVISSCLLLLGVMLYPRNAQPPPPPPPEVIAAKAEPVPEPPPLPKPKAKPVSAPTNLQLLIQRCEKYSRVTSPPRLKHVRVDDGRTAADSVEETMLGHDMAKKCWEWVGTWVGIELRLRDLNTPPSK